MSNAILLATLDALCEHWHRQSLLPTAGPTADAAALAQQHGVTLPADFIAFYRRANGMTVTSTKDTDDEGFYFLPVEALRATTEDLRVYSGRGVHQVVATLTVFADYLHASWWYGFIPAASGTGYEIGILPARGVFKVITTSLATFLNLYLEDAQVLYDYPNEALSGFSEPGP